MFKRVFKNFFSKSKKQKEQGLGNYNFADMKKESEERLSWLDEQNKIALQYSEQHQQSHIDSVNSFNRKSVKNIPENTPLSSIEKAFLQYVDGLSADSPNIAKYWTYQYNIDYKYLLDMFISNGYVEVSNKCDLTSLKLNELKDLLRVNGLKVSGKKSELIQRVTDNIPLEKLDITGSYRFVLTEKGIETVKSVKPSATKNTDLKDKCISYLKNGDFEDAYREICKSESEKKLPSNLGVDWKRHLQQGISDADKLRYSNIFNADISKILPMNLLRYESLIKVCVILGMMLGASYSNTGLLIKRVINDNDIDIKDLLPVVQKITIGDFENKIQESIDKKKAILLNRIKNVHVDFTKFKSGQSVVDEEYAWVTRHMTNNFTEESVVFFKHLIDTLIYEKLYGEVGLELSTSGGKVFSVSCSRCYIGKIKLQDATFMQILTGFETDDIAIIVNDLTLSQYILLIPEWIKYIKKCVRV